jgi:hypothetical protein
MPLASTYPLPSRFSDSNQKVGHQRRDHLPPTYAGSPTFNKTASADIMTRIATIISVLGILPPTARLQVTGLHVKSDKSCQLYYLQPVFCIVMRLDRGQNGIAVRHGHPERRVTGADAMLPISATARKSLSGTVERVWLQEQDLFVKLGPLRCGR